MDEPHGLGVGFSSLPVELVTFILAQRLRPADILNLSFVSKEWRHQLSDERGSLAYELCLLVHVPKSALKCLVSLNKQARVTPHRLPMWLLFLALRDYRRPTINRWVATSYGTDGDLFYWGSMDACGMPDGVGIMMSIPDEDDLRRPIRTHQVDSTPILFRCRRLPRAAGWRKTHGAPTGNWYLGVWKHGELVEGLTSSTTFGFMCIASHPASELYGAYVCSSAIERACYTGQVKDGQYDGYGLWEAIHVCQRDNQGQACGCRFVGEWKNSSPASGCLTYLAGLVYEGEFSHNQFEGNGSMVLPCGAYYTGEWRGGMYNPLCIGLVDVPRGRYEGQFQKGKRKGNGVQHYTDGSVYEGSWWANQPHGKGVMTHPDGKQISCRCWRNGKPHEKGTIIKSNGRRRNTFWIHGERCSRLTWVHYTETGKKRSTATIIAIDIFEVLFQEDPPKPSGK